MKKTLLATAFLLAAGTLSAQVLAREEKVVMPAWEIGPSEVHTNFSDAGGRQGDANVYPYTLNDILTNNKVNKTYNAVILENEYIKVTVLPEIGGRLHGALDKTNKYAWIYTQKTIKPGLISMTGAWISGGIEWNFPHGHRPSGFMKVDHRLIKNADGSATVWVGETEPIYRMRWLVGMTVYPGKSYVRCDYIFINPTNHKHPFQFWATASTHANEYAQAQYPGDMVTGHGKHEFWNWPIHNGVDLTWWKNSPNASSYFAFNNPSDWFGAYDHNAQGGMVHVANHNVMPGKKLWTWGSGPSGRIWEDILTEGGGPYFEPQAGAWSDNQPDYHWMQPQEVKTTHDFWYPVRDTRGYHNADQDFAINTDLKDGKAFAGVYATSAVAGYKVVLKNTKTNAVLSEKVAAISPAKPYTVEVKVPEDVQVYDLHLAVYDAKGKLRIELQQKPPQKVDLPPGQKDPGDPKKMNQDELFQAGDWLNKYVRSREAQTYFKEALARDPKDFRVNLEMGMQAVKLGNYEEALRYFNTAMERDWDNSRVYFGRALAYLGLNKKAEAYADFYRSTYTADYFAPAYLNLAKLDLMNGDYKGAIEKTQEAESQNARFADIQGYKAAAYRLAGQSAKALAAANKALELDPMHFMGGYEKVLALKATGGNAAAWEQTWRSIMRGAEQNYLELATYYGNAGLYKDADRLLAAAFPDAKASTTNPMVYYLRGYYAELAGDADKAATCWALARKGAPAWVNPHRLEEKDALEAALRRNPDDANAHLFLGNLLYSKQQREQGFEQWQKAVELQSDFSLALRNVAYGQRFLKKDLNASYETYKKVMQADPKDGRALSELDQVAEALKVSPADRFAFLSKYMDAVNSRDDLIAQMVDLRLGQGDPENLKLAHDVLRNHHFHSWEGKYGIHSAWVDVNQRLGDLAFGQKDYQTALKYYEQACEYPKNLEVAARTPDFRAHVNWNLAKVYLAMGQSDKASTYLKDILAEKYNRPHIGTFYQAMAQKSLKNESEYRTLLDSVESRARDLTSGKFENRGSEEIGYYLLSLVLNEKGDQAGSEAALKKALDQDPQVARIAIREAQLDIARAHQ